MRYRVHYMARNERRMDEVEAASPAEAMVKIRHTRDDDGPVGVQVLSIHFDDEEAAEEDASWW